MEVRSVPARALPVFGDAAHHHGQKLGDLGRRVVGRNAQTVGHRRDVLLAHHGLDLVRDTGVVARSRPGLDQVAEASGVELIGRTRRRRRDGSATFPSRRWRLPRRLPVRRSSWNSRVGSYYSPFPLVGGFGEIVPAEGPAPTGRGCNPGDTAETVR